MQNKIAWEEGTAVTAEDIVASLKPLVDEYFVGSCRVAGEKLFYTLPDGRTFSLTANRKTEKRRRFGCLARRGCFYGGRRFGFLCGSAALDLFVRSGAPQTDRGGFFVRSPRKILQKHLTIARKAAIMGAYRR